MGFKEDNMAAATAAAATMAGLTVLQGVGQANASRAQGEYQKAMSEINARNAEIMAKRRIEKGAKDAELYGQKINQTVGSQKASYASQGVSLDSDVVQQVEQQTREIGFEDIQQIKTNAFLEAMGYKSQAQDMLSQGRMAQRSGETNAFNTILGSAVNVARIAYDYKWDSKPSTKQQDKVES